MGVNRQVFVGDNIGAPSTAQQFGPHTIGGVGRVIKVKGTLSVGFAGINTGPASTLVNGISWGVQSGPTGYTALLLPAQIGAFNWYWSELISGDSAGGAAWTPPTNNVGWMGFQNATEEWRGLLTAEGTFDFYLTTGATVAGIPGWVSSWTFEVIYSD